MNKIIRFLLLMLALVSISLGAQTKKSTDRKTKFDYDWKFKLGDHPDASHVNYNDVGWRKLDLPHDWSIEGAFDAKNPMGKDGGYLPAGIGWYRKTVNIPAVDKGKKLSLYFEGVYMNSEVFINGISVGVRPYGFSSFSYDISPFVKFGQNNVIAVRVDNSQQKNCRWYSGSGIYRHVWLTTTNPVHTSPWGVAISTPQADTQKATVSVKAVLQNETSLFKTVQLAIQLYDGNNKKVGKKELTASIPSNVSKEFSVDIAVKIPNLWSPEMPYLYKAEISILEGKNVVDEISQSFGIRTIEYSADKGFVLNGRQTKINGSCVHHDNGALGAAAYDRAEIRKVALLKSAGFNAVRTSHNPPSEAFLNACDSLGLLVMDESFDGWREKKNEYDYSVYFDAWWQKDIEAMVLRDRNHPSIVFWSTGNEIIERKSPEAVETAKKLAGLIRKLDSTRPVTSAMTTWDETWEIFDPLFAVHDIGGYNYQMHHAEEDHKRVPNRIIIQTESFPRDAFNNWKAVNDLPYVIGDFVWTGMDYLGESSIGRYYYKGEIEGQHWQAEFFPWHGSYCGDIDLIGWRKPISHYREILYSNSKKIYLAVKEPDNYYGEIKETMWSVWPTWESWTWPGHEGKSIEVEVYSNYDKVRLYCNGSLIGEKATTRSEEFKAVFKMPYLQGELKAVGMVNGKETEIKTLKTAGETAKIKLSPDNTTLKADGQDLIYVMVGLTDAQGIPQPNAENQLTFEVTGAGTIAGVANANLKDIDPYVSTHHKAWKGQALLIIKSKREKGTIQLKVTSPGIQSQILTLKAK